MMVINPVSANDVVVIVLFLRLIHPLFFLFWPLFLLEKQA
jgi:hypothetical protein